MCKGRERIVCIGRECIGFIARAQHSGCIAREHSGCVDIKSAVVVQFVRMKGLDLKTI